MRALPRSQAPRGLQHPGDEFERDLEDCPKSRRGVVAAALRVAQRPRVRLLLHLLAAAALLLTLAQLLSPGVEPRVAGEDDALDAGAVYRMRWRDGHVPKALPSCGFKPMALGRAPAAPRRLTAAAAGPRDVITSVCVIGERHSGTNLVTASLAGNLRAGAAPWWQPPAWLRPPRDALHGRQSGVNDFVWEGCTAPKHNAQPTRKAAAGASGLLPNTLVVIIVRNPFDWVVGLCAKPWEVKKLSHNVPLRACMGSLWYNDGTAAGQNFTNVFALRRAKHRHWMQTPWAHVELLQYECLLQGGGAGAATWLRSLARRYGLRRARGLRAGAPWKLPESLNAPYNGAVDWHALEASSFPATALDMLSGVETTREAVRDMHRTAELVLQVGRPHEEVEGELGYGYALQLGRKVMAATERLARQHNFTLKRRKRATAEEAAAAAT